LVKVIAFQHVPNEPLGLFETILRENGTPYEYVRLYETNEVPLLDSASHLIFMGGPMSVNDEREYPYLKQEKTLIRRCVATGKPVLGVCLGAQLIADACGGRVYPDTLEIGWHHVQRVGDGPLLGFPSRFPVFQLHGETFDIPPGGTLLCTGDTVKNQAFSYGSALGLQFHLEPTIDVIKDWVFDIDAALRDRILQESGEKLAASSALCHILADRFFASM
jgi:GMP synthase (glutamine-hydrolysing)